MYTCAVQLSTVTVVPTCCAVSGQSVVESLVAASPSAVVKVLDLDTADSSSIQKLAATVKQEYDQQIDLLVRHTSTMSGNAALQGGQLKNTWDRLQTEQACIHQHWCVLSTSGDSEVVRDSFSATSRMPCDCSSTSPGMECHNSNR